MILISEYMREQNRLLHQAPEGYGGSGWKSADAVMAWAEHNCCTSILDYGCGEGTLKTELEKRYVGDFDVREYDPCVEGKSERPQPADMLVCTDVLEHVEPECLRAVLEDIYSLAQRACYIIIATRQSNKSLPNGRNTHLILAPVGFWLDTIQRFAPFRLHAQETFTKEGSSHSVIIHGRK